MTTTNSTMNSMPADRESLYLMTKLKLDRFKQRKVTFDETYAQIMAQVNAENISLADQVNILHKGVQALFQLNDQDRYLANFNELSTIANVNTSTSNGLLRNFYQQLRKVIEGGKQRSEYNYLFGLIMSQWFLPQQSKVQSTDDKLTTPSINSILTNERLETIIFDQPQLDYDKWRHFLEKALFSRIAENPKLKDVFKEFKEATKTYGDALLRETVSCEDVKRTMRELLRNSLLDDHRKRLMEKLSVDENAVTEFASSLTLLKSDLAKWNWPREGVRGIFRRNLTGKYRCFYEEDFLTAVFLHYLGLKWTYHFKRELQKLFDLLTEDVIENQCVSTSIQYKRIRMQRNDFWMASLPDQTNETVPYSESYSSGSEACGGVNLKTKLLHLINTEIQLHQTIHPNSPFIVMCADLEWFGPSIPHKIIQILFDVCGMPQIWLDFFDRFLKQPVFYKPNELVRERQRGVPVSHSLSLLFSELILFGMDLYVYLSTGMFNYRLHDDFWFFHADLTKVEHAWALMNEYANMTGLKFNDEKCGSVQIRPSITADDSTVQLTKTSLPEKVVKWGLLNLESSGRFIIDQNAMKSFLDELKTRLTSSSTILEWVNLYNKYMTFFMRNFGQSSYVLGTFHTEKMIETFRFIHRYVFDQSNGNAWIALTDRIQQQFSACVTGEILEGWLYWPITHGGLGLRNVYLDLYSFHNALKDGKITTFAQQPERDLQVYNDLKEKYEQWKKNRYTQFSLDSSYEFVELYVKHEKKFMSYDQFIGERETRLFYWTDVYKNMLKLTEPALPKETDALTRQMDLFNRETRTTSRRKHHRNAQSNRQNDSYLQWLVCYYGEQIESTFEQLDFIDSVSIPIGLIKIMKTSDVDWDKEVKE